MRARALAAVAALVGPLVVKADLAARHKGVVVRRRRAHVVECHQVRRQISQTLYAWRKILSYCSHVQLEIYQERCKPKGSASARVRRKGCLALKIASHLKQTAYLPIREHLQACEPPSKSCATDRGNMMALKRCQPIQIQIFMSCTVPSMQPTNHNPHQGPMVRAQQLNGPAAHFDTARSEDKHRYAQGFDTVEGARDKGEGRGVHLVFGGWGVGAAVELADPQVAAHVLCAKGHAHRLRRRVSRCLCLCSR